MVRKLNKANRAVKQNHPQKKELAAAGVRYNIEFDF